MQLSFALRIAALGHITEKVDKLEATTMLSDFSTLETPRSPEGSFLKPVSHVLPLFPYDRSNAAAPAVWHTASEGTIIPKKNEHNRFNRQMVGRVSGEGVAVQNF